MKCKQKNFEEYDSDKQQFIEICILKLNSDLNINKHFVDSILPFSSE